MARPRVADREHGLQICWVAANILNKQSWTAEKGWSFSLGVEREVNNSVKKTACCDMLPRASDLQTLVNTVMNIQVP
jgi:hypothetical protein